jgi:hypothetical protein
MSLRRRTFPGVQRARQGSEAQRLHGPLEVAIVEIRALNAMPESIGFCTSVARAPSPTSCTASRGHLNPQPGFGCDGFAHPQGLASI